MDIDLAEVKPSILSFFTVGILAVVFIVLLKFVAAKSGIKSFEEFVGSI